MREPFPPRCFSYLYLNLFFNDNKMTHTDAYKKESGYF